MTTRQHQHLLAYLGYYEGDVDGNWGERSRDACIAFQQDAGIVPDGQAGPVTEQALKEAVAYDRRKPVPESSPESFWKKIRFFTEEEFRCKCGGRYCNGYPARMQEQVVGICDAARQHFGKPGYVVSGLRCSRWNALQGGVENSQHIFGEAVDLRIEGVSADALLAFIQTQPHRYAYKINGTNVHVDIPKGAR